MRLKWDAVLADAASTPIRGARIGHAGNANALEVPAQGIAFLRGVQREAGRIVLARTASAPTGIGHIIAMGVQPDPISRHVGTIELGDVIDTPVWWRGQTARTQVRLC